MSLQVITKYTNPLSVRWSKFVIVFLCIISKKMFAFTKTLAIMFPVKIFKLNRLFKKLSALCRFSVGSKIILV